MTNPVMRDSEHGDAHYVLTITCDAHAVPVTVEHLGWWPPTARQIENQRLRRLAVQTGEESLVVNGVKIDPTDKRTIAHYIRAKSTWRSANGSIQTPYGEAFRLHRLDPRRGPFDTPQGMTHEYRFRFECPTCHLTVPVSGGRFMNILDRLRGAGVSRLSLQQVSANM